MISYVTSRGTNARRAWRVLSIAVLAVVLCAQAAFATVTIDTATGLSANVALPTVVSPGVTPFTIDVFSSAGATSPPAETGRATVVRRYVMDPSGAVTPDTSQVQVVQFQAGFNYANCGAIVVPGCPTLPLKVSAVLDVAPTTPPGTPGVVTASVTPQSGSGLVADATPAQGFVRLVNLPPNVSGISGPPTAAEGTVGTYAVSANDPQGQTLSYTWSVTSGNAAIVGLSTNPSLAVAFQDGPSSVGIRVDVSDGTNVVSRTTITNEFNVPPVATFTAPPSVPEGSPILLSFTNAVDVPADVAAGLLYGFSCDGGPFGPFGTTPSTTCSTDDNGFRTALGAVRDKDGGGTQYGASVSVKNVAPTATFTAVPDSLPEGDSFQLSLSDVFDPSSVDMTAGFLYSFDCGDGAGFGPFAAVDTASCITSDNESRVVKGLVRDKDGGSTEYKATVSILNVAPIAVFGAPTSVNEGDPFDLDLTGPFDPSTDDTAAGFAYAFDCGGDPAFPDYHVASSASCPSADNGTRNVQGAIRDKDLDATTYSATLVVANVPPSATFLAPGTTIEGSDFAVRLTGVFDPSNADTAAGFEYSFDCGGGYGPFGNADTVTCSPDDDATLTVRGRVRDKDGDASEYSATVVVTNAAPKATLVAPESVDEGTSFTLALTDASDPSSEDIAAGFEYAFDCGTGYGPFGASASRTCATADDGPVSVRAKIRDKDGAERETSDIVDVENVAPQIVGLAVTVVQSAGCATGDAHVTFTVTDPASDAADPIQGTVDWGDSTSTAVAGRAVSVLHGYTPGIYPLLVTVSDHDGGIATATTSVTLASAYTTSGILQPINADGTSTFKLGSTIPVKTRIFDCGGAPAPDLSPQVRLTATGSGSTPVNEVVSSSAADSGNVMRYDASAGQYIFNLSTKRSQFNAGNDLAAGHYRLEIVGDGVPAIVVEFSLRK